MAKKKKLSGKGKPKEFNNSPFKDLKGLSAFKPSDSEARKAVDKTERLPVEKPKEEAVSFSAEMEFLGVKPLSGKVLEDRQKQVKADEQPVSKPAVKNDQEEFLAALGSMEKVFKDEWPEEPVAPQASPRRMKQLERGQLKIEDQLDLHGLTVEEASTRVDFFLQNAIYRGLGTVLVITGKGLHSDEGPVLRLAMEKILESQSELVVEWGTAPRRHGGNGALVVFLRQMEKL